jgi:hypothetical protein
MFVRNKDVGLLLDAKDFKTLELENGTHNGQPVYRVAFKFLYMQGVALFTVAIFSKKEEAEECFDMLLQASVYGSNPQSIIDVQNKVEESLLVMPDAKDINNVVEFSK